ncbi:MAG: DegV family protein [Eubacteriales bacterium]|nr:DegV family protein [Eubacteriales bacterium]
MKSIVVVTDSSSGITPAEAKEMGVAVVPIPFTIDGEEYLENVTIEAPRFFEMLSTTNHVGTSQPSRQTLDDIWSPLLKEYEHIIYLPITSGLSGSCMNAMEYAKQYNGRVHVVDNQRISAPLKISVYEAAKMAEQGKTVDEIIQYLTTTQSKSSIYITLSTMKYLRKGGRVTPAAAVLGDMFKLKPILYTRGQNFDKKAIALTMQQAKKKMMDFIKHELNTEFKEYYDQGKMALLIAHTAIPETEIEKFKTEITAEFPGMKILYADPLCLAIACHTGPGTLGFGTCVCDYL